MSPLARVRLIGCGNPDAGDDAVGLLVVDALRARVPDGVEVVRAGPAVRVLELLDGVDAAVVVDAVRAPGGGRAPGTLVRVEAGPDGLPAELRNSLSSHGLGLAEAVGLAAAVGGAPRIVFHGVEAVDVTVGATPSVAVAAALPRLEDAVLADLVAFTGGARGGRPASQSEVQRPGPPGPGTGTMEVRWHGR